MLNKLRIGQALLMRTPDEERYVTVVAISASAVVVRDYYAEVAFAEHPDGRWRAGDRVLVEPS